MAEWNKTGIEEGITTEDLDRRTSTAAETGGRGVCGLIRNVEEGRMWFTFGAVWK